MESPTSIFAPVSTPAQSIFGLSVFVLMTVAVIFIVVFSLLAYAVVKFRDRHNDDRSEPPQIYGSNQVELAWTVIPVSHRRRAVSGYRSRDCLHSKCRALRWLT